MNSKITPSLGISGDSVYSIGFFVKFIITQFIKHKKHHQNAAGNPDCQAGDVDKGIPFVSFDCSESNFQIISKQNRSPVEPEQRYFLMDSYICTVFFG